MSTASSPSTLITARPSSAVALTCSVVADPHELDGLAPAWTDLLERSVDNRPMLAPTWLIPWWRIYGSQRQLRFGLFHDGSRLVGLAPLLSRRYWYRS